MTATVTDFEQARVERQTKQAMAFLDTLADAWAERVDLPAIAARIVGNQDAITAMMRLAYEEGAYEGHLAAVDAAGWQPIETAPESPKLPRTWLQFWNGEEIRIGYVEPDDGDGFGTQYVGQDGELIEPRLYGSSQNKPTHWRFLPEQPR